MNITGDEEKNNAVVLRFPRRRGRPRVIRPQSDSGTPELVMKRLLDETAESLDLCLERGIISREQHWCGVHLRWLYTLRHGAPSVRAIDPTHLGGIDIKHDDPEWRGAREKEYHDAIKILTPKGYAPLLMNLCVYNERPQFLTRNKRIRLKNSSKESLAIAHIQNGLALLAKHWGRSTKN